MLNLNRRMVLGALATAAFPVPARGALAGEDQLLRLGVASYSLRRFSRADAIKMVKSLNTRFINIKDFHLPLKSTPEEIAAGRKDFEEAGLVILGGGNVPFQQDDDADIRHKFEYARLA